jgi:hypothetical protein
MIAELILLVCGVAIGLIAGLFIADHQWVRDGHKAGRSDYGRGYPAYVDECIRDWNAFRDAAAGQPHLRGTCWCGVAHIQVGDTVRYE